MVYVDGEVIRRAELEAHGCGHININIAFEDSQPQGTWIRQLSTAWLANHARVNTSHADGDEIRFKAFFAKGTYTLKMMMAKGEDHGIVDVDVGGTEVASFDCYNGSTIYVDLFTQTGITISEAGVKEIAVRVDGKNASATNYYCHLQAMAFYRTA